MKSRYTHLTLAEREIIRKLRTLRRRPAYIARVLGKHRSTICREIKRNTKHAQGIYLEKIAQSCVRDRRLAAKARFRRIDRDYMLQGQVEDLLKNRTLSPEQVAGYMRRSGHSQALCHKTIKRWIHRQWRTRREYLRFKGRPRTPYGLTKIVWQPHKRHISERPRIVEKRLRVGDWEADLVHGTRDDSNHCILTLNDRVAGFGIGRKLRGTASLPVAYRIAEALKDLPVHTITCDNGIEFAQHKSIEKFLGCRVYFTGRIGCARRLSQWRSQFESWKRRVGAARLAQF